MSQIALPFEEHDGAPGPGRAVISSIKEVTTKDGVEPFEEIKVPFETSGAATLACAAAPALSGSQLQSIINQPVRWPAGLTWAEALIYTSASPAQLRRWQRAGLLAFRRIGRNGAKVALRSQLDQLLQAAFSPASDDLGEDFDFG